MARNSISNSLSYHVARAHRRLHADLDQRLHEEGVTVEQWRVLDVLSDRQGRAMGELAEQVLMNHPALTKLADRMVANGLIHRVTDPQDQRRVLVHVTSRGTAIHARLKRRAEEHERAVEDRLGASKAAALKALLEDLAEGPRALQRG
ncbi:MarR family transcriptional regulator [Aquibium sp. A9E412]|uniref:MarR family winged helix-turn-helix transcriptional regulator n=1 Tax=Aquibium sp. A9E412 TaxID=2976767 RepID=UPI0025B0EE93|nr:MarR family transcriptional regulator [Aquibium sp. A9E412]MDN2567978.1 MarR family transcriptional regulator [Aquibium sp. A9E412]